MEVIESGAIAGTAAFTAFWAFKTFGSSEKKEEINILLDSLNTFFNAYKRTGREKALYEAILRSVKDFYTEDARRTSEYIKKVDSDFEDSYTHLSKVLEKSARISDRLLVRIRLWSFKCHSLIPKSSDEVSSTLSELSGEITQLKEDLRKDAKVSLF